MCLPGFKVWYWEQSHYANLSSEVAHLSELLEAEEEQRQREEEQEKKQLHDDQMRVQVPQKVYIEVWTWTEAAVAALIVTMLVVLVQFLRMWYRADGVVGENDEMPPELAVPRRQPPATPAAAAKPPHPPANRPPTPPSFNPPPPPPSFNTPPPPPNNRPAPRVLIEELKEPDERLANQGVRRPAFFDPDGEPVDAYFEVDDQGNLRRIL
jgi:hypothetical protein